MSVRLMAADSKDKVLVDDIPTNYPPMDAKGIVAALS